MMYFCSTGATQELLRGQWHRGVLFGEVIGVGVDVRYK